jgi:hypothetical protein
MKKYGTIVPVWQSHLRPRPPHSLVAVVADMAAAVVDMVGAEVFMVA